MLHLYGQTEPRNLAYSDGICSALQLINFLQDVAIDWKKARSYMPQDEMARFGLNDAQLAALMGPSRPSAPSTPAPAVPGKGLGGIPLGCLPGQPGESLARIHAESNWPRPQNTPGGCAAGLVLKGRVGFELRMIIAGGDRILRKLHADPIVSLKPPSHPERLGLDHHVLSRPDKKISQTMSPDQYCQEKAVASGSVSITASCSCHRKNAAPSPRFMRCAANSTTWWMNAQIPKWRASSWPGGAPNWTGCI